MTELDWWHETVLSFPFSDKESPSANADYGVDTDAELNLKLICTPAQHRSGRGVRDHMTTLWASWCLGVVEDEDVDRVEERGMKGWKGFKLYFGG